MVKIERLQEWAASDKCLSVMDKRLCINLYKHFYKLNNIIFYCKMAQFLINNIYFLFYKIFILKTSYFFLFWLTEIVS